MNILQPIENGLFTDLGELRNSIFLAGPCPRTEGFSDEWRLEAMEFLNSLGFSGTVITPTNPDYPENNPDALTLQTNWEYEAMRKASAIVFWINRSEKHPGLTTNIELGEWWDKPGIYIGWPENAIKTGYIKIRLQKRGIEPYSDMKQMLEDVVKHLGKEGTTWFTSDTHFGQQRTLDYSRRPFTSLEEMDLTMISNWNKNVTMQDTVIHAGDFGDISVIEKTLKTLNFKKLIWVLGNYDRNQWEEINKILKTFEREIIVTDRYEFTENVSGKEIRFHVIHEPETYDIIKSGKIPEYPEEFVLYGHIHGRAFAKKNGIDLGTDYHKYSPISLEQVLWFYNARQYWDKNVFCEYAKI